MTNLHSEHSISLTRKKEFKAAVEKIMKTRITEKESEYLFRMVDANKVNNESKLDFIFNIQ